MKRNATKAERDAARRARYEARLCQHCGNQRDCKSARCAQCRDKAAAYQQRRRDAA